MDRPDPLTLPGAVSPIFKSTAQLPGQGAPQLRRNTGSHSKKLLFAASEPAKNTTLGVCDKHPVKNLVSPGERVTVTATRSRGEPPEPESPKDAAQGPADGHHHAGEPDQTLANMRQQMRAADCLGGARLTPGMSESGAGESRQAAAVELDGEVCPAQGVKAGPLELGADPTEARCGCGPSQEIAGVAFGSPVGPCVANGADREPGGSQPRG